MLPLTGWIGYLLILLVLTQIYKCVSTPYDLLFMKDFLVKDAPYAVGVHYTRITDKRLEATIYYPVEKEEMHDKPYNAEAFPPYKSTDFLLQAWGKSLMSQLVVIMELHNLIDYKEPEDLPWFLRFFGTRVPNFMLKPDCQMKIPAYIGAKPAREELRPIIFSHGLTACNSMYSGACIAFAAQGYLVIAVNHQDGSCFHTYDSKNNDADMFYGDRMRPAFSQKLRTEQLKIRVAEIRSVIDIVRKENASLELFEQEGISIDSSELVLAGHSFGSGTMAATANELGEE